MTNGTHVLYFPATRLPLAAAGPLLLPFGKLVAYRPAEGPPAMPQPLTAAGLVGSYPPVPLGDQLDRFRRQLKDMQTHAAEYYQAYLSSLAAGAEEDIEAGWQQVARQLKQTPAAKGAREDALWRARLYLALAEQEAVLQEELAAGMAKVGRREAELLRQMQGETEELSNLPIFAAPAPAAPIRKERLLVAWGQLYLADPSPERPWLLTTAQEESAGLLFEAYETDAGRQPERLLSLPLPPLTGGPEEEWIEKRKAFRAHAGDLLGRLEELLTQAAGAGPEEIGATAAALTTAWEELLRPWPTKKPAAAWEPSGPAPGRVLTIYRLAGMSFPRLFGLLCRQDREAAGPSTPNAVLAVLS
ncbi:MAG: hypothetical protein M0017_03275 [Desulfobacteraceae bacterium]|nr:hypothetical protein [Desulfobacteraceae bacterium]